LAWRMSSSSSIDPTACDILASNDNLTRRQ
jgi:hypothetical protein